MNILLFSGKGSAQPKTWWLTTKVIFNYSTLKNYQIRYCMWIKKIGIFFILRNKQVNRLDFFFVLMTKSNLTEANEKEAQQNLAGSKISKRNIYVGKRWGTSTKKNKGLYLEMNNFFLSLLFLPVFSLQWSLNFLVIVFINGFALK